MLSEAKVNILLVDDQPSNLLVLESVLECLGQNLVRAHSGEEALRHILRTDFAVILLDMQMPGIDGLETATLIRRRERSRHTPIIFLTAYEQDQPAVVSAYAVGAVDFLFKPIVPEILKSKVAVFVELARRAQLLAERTAALSRAHDELERRVRERTADLERDRARLRESEERFRLLVDGVKDYAIFLLDAAGRVVSWNVGAERITGFNAADMVGQPLARFYAAEDAAAGKPDHDLKLAALEGRCEDEGWRARRDGTRYWANAVLTALQGAAHKPRGYVSVTRDMTERKRLEEELLQARKMEAVGHLAGGVAHDFNNLLTAISGYGELLLTGLAPDDPLHGHAAEVTKAAGRAAELTRQLLAFSRKQVFLPKVLDLNQSVANVESILRRLVGVSVQLTTRLAPEPLWVKADPVQLEQVLLNLAVNARDAMPQGGHLTIEAEPVVLDRVHARAYADLRPGPHVMLRVRDTGSGMTEDVLSHLFEPFYTTKEIGKGTGLGLSTVYAIVRRCGGHIQVCSRPAEGSTFTICLPQVEAPADATSSAAAPGAPPRGSETVLVVDDEDMVRSVMATALRRNGYRVLEAPNGSEALALVTGRAVALDLVVSDLLMPGMNGRELLARLGSVRPNLKALLVSGFTGHEDVAGDAGVVPFLQKPFPMGVLLAKVREVLDTPARSLPALSPGEPTAFAAC